MTLSDKQARLALLSRSALPKILLITGLTFWIYWPSLHGGWIWDDPWLLTKNPLIHDPAGWQRIWLNPGSMIDYQPIKVSVEWIEWQIWGNHTLGYHLLNVVLHLVSALLVWRLFNKLGLQLAWVGGLLFAVHPVMVESVAWISELKNTLSLPPFLLAMCVWIDFDAKGQRDDYLMAIGLFLIAMLCKQSMVMFPVVILLYAWWRRGRVDLNDLKLSAPFFVVSLVLGIVTLWFLEHHAIRGDVVVLGGVMSRLALAGTVISFYFAKFFWPVGLLPVYPQWKTAPDMLWQFLPWPVLFALLGWMWTQRKSWGRHALLGLGFFLVMLAPFLGFTAGSYMTFSWVLDHIVYIPIIGLIGLVTASLGRIQKQLSPPFQYIGAGFVAVVVVILASESHGYARWFISDETLWSRTLLSNPSIWLAEENLGSDLSDEGRYPEAVRHFNRAQQLKPESGDIYYNLGVAMSKMGRTEEAQSDYERAVALNPRDGKSYLNLGDLMVKMGHVPEAIGFYQQAVQLDPDAALPHYNLGNLLLQTRHLPEAIAQLQAAVEADPGLAQAHENLGVALAESNRLPEALEQFAAAVSIDPHYVVARSNYALALAQTGHIPEAIQQFQEVLKISPDDANARQMLGKLESLNSGAPGQH